MVLIESAPERRWTLAELARAVETSPAQLRATFVARYAISPLAYMQRIRAIRALALIKQMKVEAIAWEVGYRSKKDLYRALREWTGHRPRALRALSDQEIESLTTRIDGKHHITSKEGLPSSDASDIEPES
jgi:AraC family transcriptional regulator